MPTVLDIAADFRRFLAQQTLPDDCRALAEAAISAFVEFAAQQNPELLEPLVAAARSTHKAVYEVGAQLLAAQTQVFEEARQAWIRLSNDKSATARFHAVAFLDEKMPAEFTAGLLSRKLGDKAARVRAKAVEVAARLDLKTLVPEIEKLQADANDAVRNAVLYWLPILRDGYRLETTSDGHYIYFRTVHSLVAFPFWGDPTPQAIQLALQQEKARL